MGSVFSPSETLLDGNHSDYSHEKLKPIDHLNNLLISRDISPVRCVLRSPWNETSERTKREHTRKAKQALSVVLGEIAPNEVNGLWKALTSSSCRNNGRNDESVDESLMKALESQTNNDLHTKSRSYSLNKDTSPICSDTEHINNISQIRDINTKLDSFVSHINAKLETLADEITTIKENKPYSILVLEDVVSELKKEKADLIRMNEDMREKYTNLLQTASDLRTRAMNLENEKSSLMTALKLIQQDNMLSNKRNAELQNQNDNLIAATKLLQNDMEGKTKERKRNFMEANRKSPTTTSKSLFDDSVLIVETKNRFDVLDDSDSKDDDGETPRTKRSEINSTNNQQQSFSVHQQSCNDQKQSRSTHQQIHNPNKSGFNLHQQRSNIREQKPNVAIVGDSMLKYINPSKLRKSTKCNIQVKTFPGAKVSDMKHYIKPTLSRTPDCLIMHIGTNDLKNSSPSEISSSISSLGQEIRKEVPNTNLVISEVIIRNDDPSLNVKISELNKNLAQVCANNNWDFITHNQSISTLMDYI